MTWRILVADDEPDIRNLVSTFLDASDYECVVSTAADGITALQLARDERPDLVFLDIHLPGRSGWEVLELLKKGSETENTKVVFVTGLIQESVRRRAVSAGVDGYVTKPFTFNELITAAEEVLA